MDKHQAIGISGVYPVAGFMSYVREKCGQFLFISFGTKLGTKVPVIYGKSAVGFLFGPVLIPIHILANNACFARFFICTNILINRCCPSGDLYSYLAQFIG